MNPARCWLAFKMEPELIPYIINGGRVCISHPFGEMLHALGKIGDSLRFSRSQGRQAGQELHGQKLIHRLQAPVEGTARQFHIHGPQF